jgi:hypothetical protein
MEMKKIEENKIFIFYHLYCVNHSFELFLDALNRLIDSGLYQKTSNIYCNLVGDKKEDFLKLLSNKFKEDKKIIFSTRLDATGEGCTLDLLHKHSQNNPNSKILYMHSKGASYDDERRKTNPLCTTEIAKLWTNRMHDYLIDSHVICFENLNKKETDGIDFQSKPLPHYSGNFWWANSNYIKSLKSYTDFHETKESYYDYKKLNQNQRARPMFTINSKRMLAEFWLCSELKIV